MGSGSGRVVVVVVVAVVVAECTVLIVYSSSSSRMVAALLWQDRLSSVSGSRAKATLGMQVSRILFIMIFWVAKVPVF